MPAPGPGIGLAGLPFEPERPTNPGQGPVGFYRGSRAAGGPDQEIPCQLELAALGADGAQQEERRTVLGVQGNGALQALQPQLGIAPAELCGTSDLRNTGSQIV